MSIKIETPPLLTGSGDTQLRQLYAYLYRLSEQLNLAMGSMNEGSGMGAKAATPTASAPSGDDRAKTYNELRGLIVNTAHLIRAEMDTVSRSLSGQYEAISSQWGSFSESFQSTVTATAREVVQEYDYDGALQTLQEQAAGFSEYRVTAEGYIRQGFVEYDEEGLPVLGIAIGQNLKGTAVEIDGVTYEKFDTDQSCAFYTADRVSFRLNGQEVAYLSNRKLYIGDAEIAGKAVLGSKWLIDHAKGFAIKWVGGDS